MSFVVSARKYRPKSFDEVLGQSHVTDTLKSAILADKLAHAFLFTGPRGVGKTTCARILARVINSPDPKKAITDHDFGDVDIDVSLNIFELDAASNNSVEHVRNLIEQVRFQPQQGKYKVFIIDEVHMLSQSAFNAFLKTLEEPPPYAIFILATTEKHKILPTILSRCQIFDFKRIQISEVITQLETIAASESITIDDDSKYVIAEMADGAMRDALSIFDRIASSSNGTIVYDDLVKKLNLLDHDYYFKMTEALLVQDKTTVMTLFHEILMNGFEGDHFIMGLADHFRDLLLCLDERSVSLIDASEVVKQRFLTQSKLTTGSFLMTALNICNENDIHYPKAKNKRLHVEIALLKICFINQLIENKTATSATSSEKKTPDSTVKTPSKSPNKTAIDISSKQEDEVIDLSDELDVESLEDTSIRTSTPKTPSSPIIEARTKEPVVAELQNTPSISNIDSLLTIVKKDRAVEEKRATKPISIEEVQKVWDQYTDKTTTPSTRGVLEKSHLSLVDNSIQISVASIIGKEIIQQEIGLMQEIRSSINNNELDITIVIDKERFPPSEVSIPKKYLSFKEKYDLMLEKNPQLENLVKTLDLKKDNNAH